MNRAIELAKAIDERGGTAYYVGGTVRDKLLGRTNKDIDIEIFGLEQPDLESILAKFGEVNLVGRSFGVYKLSDGEGGEMDISLPRTEVKSGVGHKAFDVMPDPFMSVKEAMRRRDFTMNAVYQDVLTGKFIDYFRGIQDIEARTIRIVDRDTFKDDSLRVLRAAQFASRLGFRVEVEDREFMQTIDLSDLPAERVFGELEKLLMGNHVFHGLQTLDAVGAIGKLFPEIEVLKTVPQDPFWHPEGNVWTHTQMVMEVANHLVADLPKAERITVMLACLFHDLGKATTTEEIDGRIKAHGHSEAGVPIALELLNRLNVYSIDGFDVRTNVLQLVDKHLIPPQLHNKVVSTGKNDVKDSVFRRLSMKVNVKLLSIVSKADVLGRGEGGSVLSADCIDWFNERIEGLDIVDNSIQPLLMGRHLIELGMTPNKEFGAILAAVFEKQLDGTITTLEEALAEVEASSL